jgi:hypothetical protein
VDEVIGDLDSFKRPRQSLAGDCVTAQYLRCGCGPRLVLAFERFGYAGAISTERPNGVPVGEQAWNEGRSGKAAGTCDKDSHVRKDDDAGASFMTRMRGKCGILGYIVTGKRLVLGYFRVTDVFLLRFAEWLAATP